MLKFFLGHGNTRKLKCAKWMNMCLIFCGWPSPQKDISTTRISQITIRSAGASFDGYIDLLKQVDLVAILINHARCWSV